VATQDAWPSEEFSVASLEVSNPAGLTNPAIAPVRTELVGCLKTNNGPGPPSDFGPACHAHFTRLSIRRPRTSASRGGRFFRGVHLLRYGRIFGASQTFRRSRGIGTRRLLALISKRVGASNRAAGARVLLRLRHGTKEYACEQFADFGQTGLLIKPPIASGKGAESSRRDGPGPKGKDPEGSYARPSGRGPVRTQAGHSRFTRFFVRRAAGPSKDCRRFQPRPSRDGDGPPTASNAKEKIKKPRPRRSTDSW